MMKIISAGPLTTVQDCGRFGYMNSGFSQNGAMDLFAAKVANILVDNAPNDAVLEMTMKGITAEFTSDCVIAFTGCDFEPFAVGESEDDNIPIPLNCAFKLEAGTTVCCSVAKKGLRGYLAVAGGFDIERVMGSFSTNLKCSLGGYMGRKLKNGDVLRLRNPLPTLFGIEARQFDLPEITDTTKEIRVIMGPQDDYFTDRGMNTFLNTEYTVTMDSDRMGIRLDGEKIEPKDKVDIVSDGISFGSIQVPSSGKPIIMMADRQTTGGYAKIATVISVDLPLLAQAKPMSKVRFRKITLEEAQKLCRAEQRKLRRLELNIIRTR